MKTPPPLVCALWLLLPAGLFAANPYEPPRKSVSASGQYIIYCDDMSMRFAVSTFCEETKEGILGLLSQRDDWKIPIVITLFQPDASLAAQPPGQIRLGSVEGGGKRIEVDVTLRGNLADIRFQQLMVRATLLEMEYRDKPDWKDGATLIDPPQWLVEGFSTYLRNRNTEIDADVYKTLLGSSDMPSLADFLNESTADMNAASMKLYQAYAFSFLQLLLGLPEGQQSLGMYIHDLPLGQDGPSQDLMKHFPALGGSAESLEKWWTLSIARLAATDRYKGLPLDETEQRLAELLKFKIPVDKTGKTKEFAIEDYKEFFKKPEARPALAFANTSMQLFATEANPLYRPIVAQYLLVIEELQAGKTWHVAQQLKDGATYRQMVLKRMDDIADYLNWFEATQIMSRSNSFDDYLSTEKHFPEEAPQRNDPISRYLDSMEIEMQ